MLQTASFSSMVQLSSAPSQSSSMLLPQISAPSGLMSPSVSSQSSSLLTWSLGWSQALVVLVESP
jgi:hypothetical protein